MMMTVKLIKRLYMTGMVFALANAVTGCATAPTMISKQEAFGTMYDEKPQSILVVPAINNSTAAEAANYYSATVARPLTEQGYYVLPITITNQILGEAGISDGHQLHAVPAKRFGELFGADSVLFVTINLWDTNYYVVGGNVVVGLQYRLVSTTTNETLWQFKDEMTVNTTGDSNNGGLLGALIQTAIATSMQDYLPIAETVNARSIHTIPYGMYHPQHGLDGINKVVNASNLALETEE